MTEERLKQLRHRFYWGACWSVLFGIASVTLLALVTDTEFWIQNIKTSPWAVRFALAALVLGPAVFVVSKLITKRQLDYKEAKRQYDNEQGKG